MNHHDIGVFPESGFELTDKLVVHVQSEIPGQTESERLVRRILRLENFICAFQISLVNSRLEMTGRFIQDFPELNASAVAFCHQTDHVFPFIHRRRPGLIAFPCRERVSLQEF